MLSFINSSTLVLPFILSFMRFEIAFKALFLINILNNQCNFEYVKNKMGVGFSQSPGGLFVLIYL